MSVTDSDSDNKIRPHTFRFVGLKHSYLALALQCRSSLLLDYRSDIATWMQRNCRILASVSPITTNCMGTFRTSKCRVLRFCKCRHCHSLSKLHIIVGAYPVRVIAICFEFAIGEMLLRNLFRIGKQTVNQQFLPRLIYASCAYKQRASNVIGH